MKQLYSIFILCFFLTPHSSFSQSVQTTCKTTCEVERVIKKDPFLGVQITSCQESNSTRVVKVVEDTQAERMGLQQHDLIQSVNGVQMDHYKRMVNWVAEQKVGLPITIELIRDNKQITVKGALGHKTEERLTEQICCDDTLFELEVKKSSVYPNPTRDLFTLQFEGETSKPYQLSVVDLQGNLIINRQIQPNGKQVQEQIELTGQPAGDYIVIVEQDGKQHQQKVVFLK